MTQRNEFPAFIGKIGVARRDISPPVGIFFRNWGAAKHDVTEGVHRGMVVTVLAIWGTNDLSPLLLVSIDLGWFTDPQAEIGLRQVLLDSFSLDASRVMINLSHSHAAPSVSMIDATRPGGHLIEEYATKVRDNLQYAAKLAIESAAPATLTWRYGKCDLATNRDLPDPEKQGFIVGYNPDVPADDTLLLGRVTRDKDQQILATIVNYACHPTTLAWDNRLSSPDYIGAMREVVEGATGNAPCLFLQGASGDMAPALQYVGDRTVADRHGRRLGYAALATLEGMLPPRKNLRFDRAVESGARLGVWSTTAAAVNSTIESLKFDLPLPVKPLPTPAEVESQIASCTDHALRERLVRKLRLVKFNGNDPVKNMPAWAWRIGPAILIGQPNEAYSIWQQTLRKKWSDIPVVVMNLVNGSCGYLVPAEKCHPGLYASWQSPFANEAYGVLLEKSLEAGEKLLKS